MTQPEREPRDIGSPVTFGMSYSSSFAVDFSPRPVGVDDLHPSEVDVAPKDLPALESVDSFSDLVPPLESVATVEKEHPELLEDSPEPLASTTKTSPGDEKQPVVTPPQPPATTPSSRSAGKSS